MWKIMLFHVSINDEVSNNARCSVLVMSTKRSSTACLWILKPQIKNSLRPIVYCYVHWDTWMRRNDIIQTDFLPEILQISRKKSLNIFLSDLRFVQCSTIWGGAEKFLVRLKNPSSHVHTKSDLVWFWKVGRTENFQHTLVVVMDTIVSNSLNCSVKALSVFNLE